MAHAHHWHSGPLASIKYLMLNAHRRSHYCTTWNRIISLPPLGALILKVHGPCHEEWGGAGPKPTPQASHGGGGGTGEVHGVRAHAPGRGREPGKKCWGGKHPHRHSSAVSPSHLLTRPACNMAQSAHAERAWMWIVTSQWPSSSNKRRSRRGAFHVMRRH